MRALVYFGQIMDGFSGRTGRSAQALVTGVASGASLFNVAI